MRSPDGGRERSHTHRFRGWRAIAGRPINFIKTCSKIEVISWRYMAAKDRFHNTVKRALEKDGWTIVANPLKFKFGEVKFEVDLAADRLIVAERETEKIAVEVKSFPRASTITDFYAALGQFLSYRLGLRQTDPERVLYLAVPDDTYQKFFQL